MGKPPFKASEDDGFDMLREWEDVTQRKLQQVSGRQVLTQLRVRPEAFPSGLPISLYLEFLQH